VDWLEEEVEVPVWFPSIDKDIVLKIPRATFLKVCGNLSKHNFLRLIGVADEIRQILEDCGVTIGIDDALRALPDFFQRFSSILNYHGRTIAEFLNSIR
jgi:hypothetical protein